MRWPRSTSSGPSVSPSVKCGRFGRTSLILWRNIPSAIKILLDPEGQPQDSVGFTQLVQKAEQEARDLVFVIGGAEGLPRAWKSEADRLLALSPMTMPHELARVVLAEQIYRALTTLRGHPYPR